MCEPITISTAITAATIASSALSAGAGYMATKSQQAAAEFQSKQSSLNAAAADRAALDAQQRGDREAIQTGRKIAAVRGRQNAALAASGLDVSLGSARDLIGDTDMLGREDLGAVNENAEREANGFRISATNARNDAAMAASQAKQLGVQANLGLAGDLIGTAAQGMGAYKKYGGGGGTSGRAAGREADRLRATYRTPFGG